MEINIVAIEDELNPKNSILLKPTSLVTFPLSDEDIALIEAMKKKLYESEGLGLAATQVGVSKNISVIYIPDSSVMLRENAEFQDMHVIINAKYEPIEAAGKYADFEGCYSIKTVYGKVKRYNQIKVTYQDMEGNLICKIESGFYARVLQHEIDHLHGILITDRLTKDCIQGPPDQLIKLRRNELSDEKKIIFDNLMEKKNIKIKYNEGEE